MRFRGDTTTADWTFGRGKQSYLSGNSAIARNAETKLRTFLGECFFDTTVGVAWFTLLGQKDPDLVVLAIKQELHNCYGVVQVTDVQYSVDSTRTVDIRYTMDTIYTTGFTGSLTL